MTFDRELVIKYATEGISKEISKRYRSIRKGEKILEERRAGKCTITVSKTDDEVKEIIKRNKEKIEEIYALREDLIYALEIDELELVEDIAD